MTKTENLRRRRRAALASAGLVLAASAALPAAAESDLRDASPLYSSEDWTPVDSTWDGIEVATKDVPGPAGSATRVRMVMEASPRSVLALVRDSSRLPELARDSYVAETAVLAAGEADGAAWEDVYIRVSFPFYVPFSDREHVVRRRIERDVSQPGHHRVRFRQLPADAHPDQVGRGDVRYMRSSEGMWEIRPAPGGGSEVAYHLSSHPGGPIPTTFVEQHNRSGLPQLLRAVAEGALELDRPGRIGVFAGVGR